MNIDVYNSNDGICVDDNIDIRFIRKGLTNDYEIRILKSNIGHFDVNFVDNIVDFERID